MDKRAIWIWLQHAFGPGSPLPWRVAQNVPGGVEAFYRGGPRLWNSLAGIREKEAAALRAFSLEEAQAQLEYAQKVGWRVLTPEDASYPPGLRNIFDPPAVLYGKGTLPDWERQPVVAVVGARKAQPVSEDKGKEFGYQLAIGGAVIVTGGALGVDTAVTLGALSGQAPVVSVLPVALNSSYVSKNAFLRESIVEREGALLSEYFSQQTPTFGAFQARNRLITGLSCGVLLVQAARKSGTVMYARLAKEQDRDVFVWPGPQGDPAFAGGRDLLEDGAKAVERGEDILEEYTQRFQGLKKIVPFVLPWKETEEEPEPLAALADPGCLELSPQEEAVRNALVEKPQTVAQLMEKSGLAAGTLLGVLTQLELNGLAESCPGKRYRRGTAPAPRQGTPSQGRPALELTGEQASVLSALTWEEQSLAQLGEKTGLPAGKLLGALACLEIQGLAQSLPGRRYRRL